MGWMKITRIVFHYVSGAAKGVRRAELSRRVTGKFIDPHADLSGLIGSVPSEDGDSTTALPPNGVLAFWRHVRRLSVPQLSPSKASTTHHTKTLH
ncbi:hypothetical protein NL676_026959 [Syzygium grande]|nr:hypothetical protein NL676_026959 [Syzygium grande]